MKANITTRLIANLMPKNKPYDVRDSTLIGFIIRVNISGKMVYMCEYSRGKRVTIGKVGVLTPMQARDKAKEILADATKGTYPSTQLKAEAITFTIYIENYYKPWIEANRKRGKDYIHQLKSHFSKKLGNKLLQAINPFTIEEWRTTYLEKGIKPATLNRYITALKAAISKAVEWELIDSHPLAKLKLSKVDNISRVRYLSVEEEAGLRNALDQREEKLKLGRERANVWRLERGYSTMDSLQKQTFADHIKPMVLLSLNTGLRRGELFNLTWQDINFSRALLTVVATSAKSGKTRHIPLNTEALVTLQAWQQQTKKMGLIFASKTNQPFNNIKKAWANILKQAEITQFRWHDLRHHFASSLIMLGVDLNTVRELLGHSDIKMTLRYAHLAPEHKANAVAKLTQGVVTQT